MFNKWYYICPVAVSSTAVCDFLAFLQNCDVLFHILVFRFHHKAFQVFVWLHNFFGESCCQFVVVEVQWGYPGQDFRYAVATRYLNTYRLLDNFDVRSVKGAKGFSCPNWSGVWKFCHEDMKPETNHRFGAQHPLESNMQSLCLKKMLTVSLHVICMGFEWQIVVKSYA